MIDIFVLDDLTMSYSNVLSIVNATRLFSLGKENVQQ